MVEALALSHPLGFLELSAKLPVDSEHTADFIGGVNLACAGRKQRARKGRGNNRDSVGRELVLHFWSPVVVRTNTVAGRGAVASLSPEGRDL